MAVVDDILAAKAEWLTQLKNERKRLEWELARVSKAMTAFESIDEEEGAPASPTANTEIPSQSGEFDRDMAEAMVLAILIEAPRGGMRPKEVTLALRKNGIPVNDQFASNVLWKLTNRTRQTQAAGNGRYTLRSAEPANAETLYEGEDPALPLETHSGAP